MDKIAQKRAEMIWLYYLNEATFRAGLITQKERDLLRLRICTRQAKHTSKDLGNSSISKSK